MQEVYQIMLEELEDARHEVSLVPGHSGKMLRVATCCNPRWYWELCDSYKRPRSGYPRPRTIIRRIDVMRALQRLIEGDESGEYARRVKAIAERHAPHYARRIESCRCSCDMSELPEF